MISNILFVPSIFQGQLTTLQPTEEVSALYLRWLNINSGSPLPDVILLQIKINGMQVNQPIYPFTAQNLLGLNALYPILTSKMDFVGKELLVAMLPAPQKLYDIAVLYYDISGALISITDAQLLLVCEFSK